ncbi:metal-dependent hydrolase [Paenibacillus sediminis]|uniref:Inner membrane protein n=1 Tax=Paenibacillus sediminis TaxID=664909 RepID=A0ABS4H610_9BACL|nr:metal-dependent hydrolase [Paenibacillus sediminis]MBP1937951.1 inner membrane protein [Paenibacillus sediminis]
MDTATHLVMGFGLAGLAYVDPAVAADSTLAAAVMTGTVAGSQAPDFDALLRLKSNALYIRNHRGISHSIPFLLIWPALITLIIHFLFPHVLILHVFLWTLLAVAIHIFIDLFNTYGTQAARPFSEKWISWNIIHIFDPFIFTTHVIAIGLWFFHIVPPAPLFICLYIILAMYYAWRTIVHFQKTKEVKEKDTHYMEGDRYFLIPTVSLRYWHVVKRRSDGSYDIGSYNKRGLKWKKHVVSSKHPAVELSKRHKDIQSFLYFTSFAVAEVEQVERGTMISWADVRYWHRKQFPFVAVLILDKNNKPIDTYVGWLSEKRMEKKLHLGQTDA